MLTEIVCAEVGTCIKIRMGCALLNLSFIRSIVFWWSNEKVQIFNVMPYGDYGLSVPLGPAFRGLCVISVSKKTVYARNSIFFLSTDRLRSPSASSLGPFGSSTAYSVLGQKNRGFGAKQATCRCFRQLPNFIHI